MTSCVSDTAGGCGEGQDSNMQWCRASRWLLVFFDGRALIHPRSAFFFARPARSSAQDIVPSLILQHEPKHVQVSRRRLLHSVPSQHVEAELKFEATSHNGEQLQSLRLCFLGRLGEVA